MLKKTKAMIFGTRSKIKKARGLKVVALGKEIQCLPINISVLTLIKH